VYYRRVKVQNLMWLFIKTIKVREGEIPLFFYWNINKSKK
jgi:hypothetical protein